MIDKNKTYECRYSKDDTAEGKRYLTKYLIELNDKKENNGNRKNIQPVTHIHTVQLHLKICYLSILIIMVCRNLSILCEPLRKRAKGDSKSDSNLQKMHNE